MIQFTPCIYTDHYNALLLTVWYNYNLQWYNPHLVFILIIIMLSCSVFDTITIHIVHTAPHVLHKLKYNLTGDQITWSRSSPARTPPNILGIDHRSGDDEVSQQHSGGHQPNGKCIRLLWWKCISSLRKVNQQTNTKNWNVYLSALLVFQGPVGLLHISNILHIPVCVRPMQIWGAFQISKSWWKHWPTKSKNGWN